MKYLKISPNSLNLSACMTEYMYDKVIEAAPERKSDFLEKGDMIHVMLAEYYRLKMLPDRLPHAMMIEQAIEKGRHRIITMDIEIEVGEDEIIPTFRGYCEFWQNDNEMPVAVEEPVVMVMYEKPDVLDDNGEIVEEGITIIFEMVPDIIFENRQGLRTWTDHKTRSRNQEALPLNNQFLAYAWASGTRRSMRNNIGFQKTLPAEKKFTRDFFPYPQGVIDWWVGWSVYRAQFIDACIKADNYPPDFTQCSKYGRGCSFIEVCMQNPADRERFLNENFVRRRRLKSIYDRR